MILYVNGDSHAAGAEAVNTFCFAEDDPNYTHLYKRPHPDNLEVCYGKVLARALNTGFATDAESSSSNDRILRTSKEFLSSRPGSIALIGWSTPEREEWLHNENYYQITASGTDSVPEELEDRYKSYVSECTNEHYHQKLHEWSEKIYNFHVELVEQKIKHLFFGFMNDYNLSGDWWIDDVYFSWLKQNGYKTRTVDSFHFGKDGHTGWAKKLIPHLQKLF